MQSTQCAEIEFYGVTEREVLDQSCDRPVYNKGRKVRGVAPAVRFLRADCKECPHHWLAVVADSVDEHTLECPMCGACDCTPIAVGR